MHCILGFSETSMVKSKIKHVKSSQACVGQHLALSVDINAVSAYRAAVAQLCIGCAMILRLQKINVVGPEIKACLI